MALLTARVARCYAAAFSAFVADAYFVSDAKTRALPTPVTPDQLVTGDESWKDLV